MDIIFHGGAREVGRSCIEIKDNGSSKRVILDCGIKVHEHGIDHPTTISDMENIDALFLSHAHLDHTGSLPLFDHMGMKCPIFCTPVTKSITKTLLDDSFHIQLLKHKHPAYSEFDIDDVMKRMRLVDYRKKGTYSGIDYEFFDAGHIPGSASILLEIGGKRILYTGDFNTVKTRLLSGADTTYNNIDVMITESTYGDCDHPSRKKEENSFIQSIKSILAGNGSVLIPVFSLGRAQEIALLLSDYEFPAKIYMDGMARKITRICTNAKRFESSDILRQAMKKIKMVNDRDERERIIFSKGIFLSTSGMLNGGPVLSYLNKLWHNPRSGILMTGYQANGTNGRMLLESERAYVDGMQIHFDGPIKKYDFSAHSGKNNIVNLVKKIRPKNLIINHGDHGAMIELENSVKGIVENVFVPEADQLLKI
ncbi:MAG: MBL fold metallo-hydrolase [Candidatus Woesearchaeota archaeon]